ncbi:phosphatidylglycerophosphate phosphatase PTPMT1-like [Andrographis paniculata]|uniref:phosphatidylglycerophosphate phosphatase PTPMT1-like n=1 Tax=Andrographis paniculata TaxID=175694 RepID=UPI0021E724E7|nr:phosphatidylglycerophosphate phosphatase PTPMT1-like [Andrographis paniculata]
MHIEELKEISDSGSGKDDLCKGELVVWDPKRVLVGAGARALFYPTLLYNVVRNKIQPEFRWWDRVDEHVLLGAVPFPADIPRLKALDVGGVVTLNESYETLVPTSLYHNYGIEHLVIPTRDYLFAPSYVDICQAVEFIHGNALCGKTTYVHCKAGRGRSTTIVLCYLVKYKEMVPEDAYEYVRSIRPRVLLAASQRQAVRDYYYLHMVKKPETKIRMIDYTPESAPRSGFDFEGCDDDNSLVLINDPETEILDYSPEIAPSSGFDLEDGDDDDSLVLVNDPGSEIRLLDYSSNNAPSSYLDLEDCDDNSLVLVTDSDLDGYEENSMREMNVASRVVQFAGQAAVSRISCLWLRCHTGQKVLGKKVERSDREIRVY